MPTKNRSHDLKRATGSALDVAEDAVERTAAWAGDAGATAADRARTMAATARSEIDGAASSVKRSADATWERAQAARDQARDAAREMSEHGQWVVRRAQQQPIVAMLATLFLGIVIGSLIRGKRP